MRCNKASGASRIGLRNLRKILYSSVSAVNEDVMGSQPSPLSGFDYVRLGLIEIGRRTCSLARNKPNGGASEVCQLDLGPHRGRVKESETPGEEVRPASL